MTWVKKAALLGVMIGLSGCATVFPEGGNIFSPPIWGNPKDPVPTQKPVVETGPKTAEQPIPVPRAKPARQADAQIAALPPKTFPLKELVGLDEARARDLLGQPQSIVEKSVSQVWQYRAETCALDLFLFPDLATQTLYVLEYDVLQPTAGGSLNETKTLVTGAEEACWSDLQALKAPQRS